MTNTDDIRTTGPVGLKGLSAEQRRRIQQARQQAVSAYRNRYNPPIEDTSEVQRYSPEEGMASWGSSRYDNPIQPTYLTSGEMQDTRYENQPWYDTLANGIGKMLGTAGTTFVSSLVGLPAGIAAVGRGLAEGEENPWANLWDNDVTNGLAQVDDWLEKNMTNYKSQEQEQNKWWQNIGSMNWWADDVIKNMGFTLGAAASMAVGSGGLGLLSKGLGLVKNVSNAGKMANNFLSALFSATGEGMIEARQGVEERNKLELQRLDNALNPEYTALQNQEDLINQQYQATGDYQSYRQQMADLLAQRQELDNKREQGLQQIEESGRLMGNKILLANQGLLTLGNMIQFGKTMTKSFDSARHAAEVSSKAAKPSWVNAQRVSNNIKDGYQVTGKGAGRLAAATKGLLTEGSEEMNQQWIQSASGAYYNKEDVNDYWKAKLNHDAVKDTAEGLHAFNQAISQGFRESWGDIDQWEQFVIGGLTGMAGSYAPTKLFNQDKTKKLFDPRRYGEWSGGAYNEIRDFNKEYNQYAENIDDVNKILASDDFFGRVRDFVGHTYTEGNKTVAAENNDKKQWKDEDDKQMIHDVQAFLRAGKLDDLRAIYHEMGDNLSDDDIDNIVKSTTKEITQEEDKQNYAAAIDEQIAEHQRKITQLNQQAQDIAEAQEGVDPSERSDYQASVTPTLENIFAQIDDENDTITNLQQQKEGYAGQKYYEGAYVDRQGNRTKTNDEIREEIKHNAEELDRKVDSYLDSIDYVNQRTNGQLTKDQEDNLAYLHNVGSESVERMSKIMSNIRQQLPQKLLFKTDKTPEQLSKENASSDRAFSKNEDTKEGYVEVDTSLMNDRAFADFFQREIMRGGNIRPEFGETAEEKTAREEEEKGLPEEEKKKRAKERATKKWKESIKHQQDEANEQRVANLELIEKAFRENSKNNGKSRREEDEGLQQLWQDMLDAGELYNQAGAYFATLEEYIKNPQLIDEAKEKEENKASKEAEQRQTKNKFAGKTARQMNQEVASGELDIDDLDDFADMDLSDVTDDDFKAAQEEAKKSREIRQKGAALRSNIQENLGDNPSAEDIDQAELAMQMITNAELNAESPDDINIEAPEINQIPIDRIPTDLDADALDTLSERVQEMISDSFNVFQEAEDAKEIIPDEAPENPDVSGVEMPETGKDPVTKVEPEVVAPKTTSNTESKNDVPVAKSPLAENALDNIIHEMQRVYDRTSTNGVWRSTTTRHPYGRSTGTYHENVAKVQFGEDSIEYKRSKAIWEYLNSVGAFDRQDNSDKDKIKEGDTIHFMVRLLEGVQKDFSELTDEEKPYSLVILMLNDKGEVLGDLPLAQLEPSYKSGNMNQQVKDLLSLQEKIFDAFIKNRLKGGTLEAIVDSGLHKDATDNLNLTFDNRAKTPLVSKVKQVMNGVVPFRKSEIHTLNDIADGQPFELGVQVTGNNVAIKKGDKTQHRNIRVPKIGSLGQPYILLPTAAGNKMAVPFYMKPFDAEKHQNTEFYKILSNAVFYLVNTLNTSPSSRSEYFRKHIDVIEGLLQVKRQEGAEQVIEVTKDSVTLHLQSLTAPEQQINVSVPNTGDNIQIAKALVNALSGIPINVSLQYLNDTIETGIANNEKYTRSYNRVIGEIADVNLPKGTHQTTNNWFTVELAPSTGVKKSLGVRTRTTGVYTEVIGGRRVEIDTDKLEARDADGELIEDDEEINLMLAQIKANKPLYRDKDYIKVDVGGETRTYDVKNKKFVKSQPRSTTNRAKGIVTSKFNGTMPVGMKNTVNAIDKWQREFSSRLIFDRIHHRYYLDGKPIDYSVTQYLEYIYGKKNIEGNYDHSSALGNTVDSLSRDFFENPEKAINDAYPNLNDARKQEVLADLNRFKAYLDKEYGRDNYVVITDDNFKLAASIETPEGVKTIGGATDMIVIDSEGRLHIYDFKVKKNNFEDYDNARDYTAQQNMYKKVLETIPGVEVEDLHLVWFGTDYLGIRSAKYQVNDSGQVTITIGQKTVPIEESDTFKTPHLSENDSKAFIKLQVTDTVGGKKLPNVLPAPSQAVPSALLQDTDDMNIGGIDSSAVANGRVIFGGVQSNPVNSATAKQQPTEPKDDNPMALPTSKKDAEDALRSAGKQMKDAMNTSGDIEEMEALLELGQVAIDQARAAGVGEGIIKNIEGIRKGLQVKYNNHKRAKGEGSSKPIDILVGWAEGRISGEDAIKQLDGTEYVKHTKGSPALGTKDSVHLSNKVEWELGKYIKEKYPFLTYGNVSVATGVSTFGGNMNLTVVRDAEGNEYGTPSNFLRSLATNPNGKAAEAVKKGLEAVSKNPNKTIQEIEEEMKKNRTVTRQNKDAWAAIPDELKLKLVNNGAVLQLDYNGRHVTISLANRNEFVKELSNANMPAKTGSLTVTEAVKPMERKGIVTDREKEKAAKRWLAKNLPMLNSEERTLFVEKIIRNGDNAYKMWGSYRSGVIEIQRNAPIGTVYHEAFHYVMDMILSDEERRNLLDVAREEYGVQDDWTAEERLANDFRRYAIDENATGIVGRIKKWIRRLRDKITRHSMISDTTVRQLFWKINNGEFAQRSVDVEKFENVQQRVLREIRNVQQEKYIWQNLSEGTKNNLKDAGLTEKMYQNMSLEEKEQYVRCRG